MRKTDRIKLIIAWFEQTMPQVQTELNYRNPYELLVAVMLSAQCTDKRVNTVTPDLFRRFPDAYALAQAEPDEVFDYIRSVTYPNSKARHLVAAARRLTSVYQGCIPDDLESLQTLDGVGRKTANVLMSVLFQQPNLAVDTHVFRVAARLGLTIGAKTPLACEKQLLKIVPQTKIHNFHHWLILHGRYTCMARKPKCEACGLANYCKYFQTLSIETHS